MSPRVPFDDFADIYDVWCSSAAAVTDANKRFYVEEYTRAGTPVVELGIGDGRIAVEAAREGVSIVGVDSSSEMLALCRGRFEREGLADRLELLQADFLAFELGAPAHFAAIPFHTIGTLVGLDAKRAFLQRIHDQLAPGGTLVFDHFVCNLEYGASRNGIPELRAEFRNAEGRDVLLWSTSLYDFEHQKLRIVTWTDTLAQDGSTATERRYRRVDFSWIDPEDARTLLEETGFAVEHLYGDFDRSPFGPESHHQVWVARRST